MNGMVNKAMEEMVVRAHGEATWLEIKRRAGVTEETFISNEGYPDEITYQLVGAASAVTGTPVGQILHAFGEHWVLNTARKGYGPMMAAGGRTLRDFLVNLPHFHDRVALLYSKLAPPRFEVTDSEERSLRLHYLSHRPGLTPFVQGLLSGLGQMFDTPVRVTLEAAKANGSDHDIFLVQW
jgi:hypothetical protein